jgi:hypothetical protein
VSRLLGEIAELAEGRASRSVCGSLDETLETAISREIPQSAACRR